MGKENDMNRKTRNYTLTGLTEDQARWLAEERERTGFSISTLIRMLIQHQIDGTVYRRNVPRNDGAENADS